MTDVERFEGPAEVETFGRELSPLEQWALDARQAHQVALSLVRTSFVPESYRGNPDQATAAILLGQEVGLQPMAALRSIDVVDGTPALRAITMRALVQAAGHEVWVEEQTQSRAVVKGRRKGSEQVQSSVWDTTRAQQMSLMNEANYKSQPGAMFVARATSEVCRLIASDALMGLAYAAEDLDDGTRPDEVQEKRPSSRMSRAKKPAAKAVEPKQGAGDAASPSEPVSEAPASVESSEVSKGSEAGAQSSSGRDESEVRAAADAAFADWGSVAEWGDAK